MKKEKTQAKFDYQTIKSFEDACKKENVDPTKLPDVSMIPKEFRKPIINVYKLYIIFKAINNGWIPNWNNYNQHKYFPWFYVKADAKHPSSLGFSGTYCDRWGACTAVGSRLCCESSEKALYTANTFQEEYKYFLLDIK